MPDFRAVVKMHLTYSFTVTADDSIAAQKAVMEQVQERTPESTSMEIETERTAR